MSNGTLFIIIFICLGTFITGFACGYDYRDRHDDPIVIRRMLYIPEDGLHTIDDELIQHDQREIILSEREAKCLRRKGFDKHIVYDPVKNEYFTNINWWFND